VPFYRMAAALQALVRSSGPEPERRLQWPVVSIGNLSTGGMGKTPLTVTLARELTARGFLVDVLSRGYGRQDRAPAKVRPDGTAAQFGDEPLLIAQEAEVLVYVAPERFEAGKLAESEAEDALRSFATEQGAQANPAGHALQLRDFDLGEPSRDVLDPLSDPLLPVHLLDDGFQHRQLARTVNILLLNQDDWDDRLLPAGNLREPRDAARRADVIAVPANEPELEVALHLWGWDGPLWRLHRKMAVPRLEGTVAAFCGIARPAQFFAGLEAEGLQLALRLAFADHCPFTPALVNEMLAQGKEAQVAAFVTTRKDFIRLGRLASLFPESMPLTTASLTVEIEDQAAAMDWLEARLRASVSLPPL